MTRRHRQFDTSLRLEVGRTVRNQGLSVGEVCRSVDLVDTAVRRWVAQYDAERAGGPGVDQNKVVTSSLIKMSPIERPR
jgi:transposase